MVLKELCDVAGNPKFRELLLLYQLFHETEKLARVVNTANMNGATTSALVFLYINKNRHWCPCYSLFYL